MSSSGLDETAKDLLADNERLRDAMAEEIEELRARSVRIHWRATRPVCQLTTLYRETSSLTETLLLFSVAVVCSSTFGYKAVNAGFFEVVLAE